MTQHLDLPHDLYYWGQNRLGSFIPVISWPLVHIFGMKTLLAVSLMQYLILSATALLFASLVNGRFYKVLFFAYWFFPMPFFYEHLQVGHPYAPQFFLIALSLFFYNRIISGDTGTRGKQVLYYCGLFLPAFLSVWISELSIAYVLFLLLFLFMKRVSVSSAQGEIFLRYGISGRQFITSVFVGFISLICILGFIFFAKNSATPDPEYGKLFSPADEIGNAFGMFFHSVKKTVMFGVRNIAVSFHNIILIIFGILFLVNSFRLKKTLSTGMLLFSSSAVVLAITLSSNWVFINEYQMRYFIFSHFLLVAAIFVYFSHEHFTKPFERIVQSLFFTFTFFSAFFSFDLMHVQLEKERGFAELIKFQDYKGSGFIGNYWSSYLIAGTAPDEIAGTPHEKDNVRNFKNAFRVMNSKSIYLVKNNWLESFPDTISQFGAMLKKSGEPDTISRFEFCKYSKVNYQRAFSMRELISDCGRTKVFSTGDSVLIKNPESRNDFLFRTPYVWLGPGTYTFEFNAGCFAVGGNDNMVVEITRDYGNTVLKQIIVNNKASIDSALFPVRVSLHLGTYTPNIEFRASVSEDNWFARDVRIFQK